MSHKSTGPTNPELRKLIVELRKTGQKSYIALARHLAKPKRSKHDISLLKIERISKNGDVIAVPGKVLASGALTKPVHVYAWQFSKGADNKIRAVGGVAAPIKDLLKNKIRTKIVV